MLGCYGLSFKMFKFATVGLAGSHDRYISLEIYDPLNVKYGYKTSQRYVVRRRKYSAIMHGKRFPQLSHDRNLVTNATCLAEY